MTPVFVARVLSTDPDGENAVVLQEITSKNSIKIHISPSEMFAIRGQLDPEYETGRSVHDFMGKLLGWQQAKIVKVILVQGESGSFYSTITVKDSSKQWNVSADPADAIMLALKSNASIWLHAMSQTDASLDEKRSRLQLQLQLAIEREAYEEAARLRDVLKNLINHAGESDGF